MNRTLDFAATGLLVLCGLFAIWSGLQFGIWEGVQPGAGLMPVCAGIVLAGFSIGTMLFDPAYREPTPRGAVTRPLGYMAALLAFGPLIETIGTSLSIVVTFFVMLRLVERASWRMVVLVTVAAVLTAKLLFQVVLQVPLPDNPLGFAG